MTFVLRLRLVGLLCSAFIGIVGDGEGSHAQTPHPLENTNGKPFELWKSCAEMIHPEGNYSASDLQGMFAKPQDVPQFLQNLKLAGQGDWLLQANFYNDDTLLKFFNGVKVQWRGLAERAEVFKDETVIMIDVDSRILPKMTVTIENSCWPRQIKSGAGHTERLIDAHGFLRIYGEPIPGMTLKVVRSVLGQETQNTRDMGLTADGPDTDPASQGTVVYADRTKWQQAGAEVGTTFAFQLDPPPKLREALPKEIGDDDIVVSIVMRQANHRILEK